MSNIEKIRQEIERLMKETEDSQFDKGKRYGLKTVLEFIDSLPEETCKENTDSFTSLEEAADDYADKHGFRVPYDGSKNFYDEVDVKASKEGFIAGAKWKANQLLKGSPLPEDTVLFQKGVEEGKRLMMEEAVEGEIGYWNQRGLSIRLDKSLERLGYDMDTKVRIVIVKKKEEET